MNHSSNPPPRWAVILIGIGTAVVILSVIGLLLVPNKLEQSPIAEATVAPTSTLNRPRSTPTLVDEARIDRQIVPLPTRLPTETPVSSETPIPGPTTQTMTVTPSLAPTEVVVPSTEYEGTPIAWTQEEKNALSWMCHYEVGGMGAVKYDACLSVISTVRARYVYGSGLGSDVLSVLRWPNQFNIPIETSATNNVFIGTVEQYQSGGRGSCSGYFYFDSVPGGPSLCQIYGIQNQFLDFHNGW